MSPKPKADKPEPKSPIELCPTEVQLCYTGMTALLARVRKYVPEDEQELVDRAIEGAKGVGILPGAYQMKSGEWFF